MYRQIAIALKGGLWRDAGIAKLAGALAKGGGDRATWRAEPDEPSAMDAAAALSPPMMRSDSSVGAAVGDASASAARSPLRRLGSSGSGRGRLAVRKTPSRGALRSAEPGGDAEYESAARALAALDMHVTHVSHASNTLADPSATELEVSVQQDSAPSSAWSRRE